MTVLKFYKYFCNYKITRGYTVVSLLLILSIIGFFAAMVIPRVSSFKAKGQQSEARIQLMKIYNSMHSHKLENGFFPGTKGQKLVISNFRELNNYYRVDNIRFYSKGDNIYIISSSDQFVVAYVRVLANKNLDIQRLNSKKVFCHMYDGVRTGKENCHKDQVYTAENNFDDLKEVKILKIMSED
ncbi:type II secretion system protein [Fluviispira multicolorata]|uniref:Type II secretory pathway, pseudopilin PulG n=1 Tax=Fluviispira multicolorata TaxID=2654512 RepID=A0A833JED3_9BACT|nr:type II secretion system GspH family protein [Fluviispira multicolorata]KAB8033135.1 hypothetical protein GCL57_00125 [Fluviispira multicolorata]